MSICVIGLSGYFFTKSAEIPIRLSLNILTYNSEIDLQIPKYSLSIASL